MRGRRRSLSILAATLLLLKSTWFSGSAVIAQAAPAWGLTGTYVSLITVAVQWGFVAGAALSSVLLISDVLRPIRLIFWSSVAAAAANLALLMADGPVVAISCRFVTGACVAGIYPPALKLVATWYRQGLGTAMGTLVGALTVSSGLPHLVNGLGGLAWRPVIIATSAATLVGGAVVRTLLTEGPHPFPEAPLEPARLRQVLGHRPTRLAIVGYVAHMWELYAMWAWMFVFLTAGPTGSRASRPIAAAYVTFAVFVAGGVASYTGGMLGDRLGRERTAIGMLAISGLCAATVGLLLDAPSWMLVPVVLLWGYTVVGDSVQYSALVTELADQRLVGTALTMQMALGFALTGVSVWLVSHLEQVLGWRWAFSVLTLGPVIGILAMSRLHRLRAGPAPGRCADRGPPIRSRGTANP